MSSSPLLLIDGDQYLFKAAAAVERDIRWDDENHVLCSNREQAWDVLTDSIERIFKRFDSTDHALCFTDKVNFRKAVDPTYKTNRAASRKPLCYSALRQMLNEKYKTIQMAGLEADDVMGILATKPSDRQRIIVSQDKDMKTIPSTLWNGEDVVTVTETEADYFHMLQTLTGDTSDGYPGCPGIGPKKAKAVLQEAINAEAHLSGTVRHCCWPAVVKAYEKAKLNEHIALTQARLARILRWSDWDSTKKEPILWTPN